MDERCTRIFFYTLHATWLFFARQILAKQARLWYSWLSMRGRTGKLDFRRIRLCKQFTLRNEWTFVQIVALCGSSTNEPWLVQLLSERAPKSAIDSAVDSIFVRTAFKRDMSILSLFKYPVFKSRIVSMPLEFLRMCYTGQQKVIFSRMLPLESFVQGYFYKKTSNFCFKCVFFLHVEHAETEAIDEAVLCQVLYHYNEPISKLVAELLEKHCNIAVLAQLAHLHPRWKNKQLKSTKSFAKTVNKQQAQQRKHLYAKKK